MPIVEITLIEGRSPEKKAALMKAVTEAVVATVDVKPEGVRVLLREIPAVHFAVAGIAKTRPAG